MDLYKEILVHALEQGKVEIRFSGNALDLTELAAESCYAALNKIKAIVNDDSLDDKECFDKIDKIMTALEQTGIDTGSRHDFG